MRIMIKGGVWKNTEDEILKAAVMKYGKNQWARISSLLVRKSAKQCKARWYEWLDPSIKKTEWTREEDEKLLHLARLMPTQWRTIAPIVGRTPSQCLERYEKLLDAACAKDENYEPSDDPRKLRPGEIDPNPESKPARPDPVDMDEDEKEMLSEARARLANTRGKKAKRKAREKQLEEARRLASLQKRRELKAAGIATRLRKRKRRGIDYNAEIPFEKRPPPGFFDTVDEERPAEQPRFPTTIEELEGRRRADIEAQLRKQDIARNKMAERQDAPSAILQANKLNDPEAVRKRAKLMLPPPQISDNELEEIAKMGYASDLLTGNEDLAEGSGATRALLANNKQMPRLGMTSLRTPQRTPGGNVDTVMMEAENLARLRQSQTPLLGGENPELHPSDFSGVTPKKREIRTPNPMATPLATPGSTGLTPRMGMTPRDSYSSGMTPRGTPMRDELHINEEMDFQDNGKIELRRQSEIRSNLRSGLSSLPQATNEYHVHMRPIPEEVEESVEKIEEDMSDRIAREKAEEQARHEALLKKRSKVLQRELPRPPIASLDILRNLLMRVGEDKSSFVPPTLVEQADELVNKEVLTLLEHDNAKYPLDERSDKEKKKGGKRPSNSKSAVYVPAIEDFDEDELKDADSLIKGEIMHLRLAMGHENESFDDFVKARDACLEDLMYFPARFTYGLASVAGTGEKLESLQNEFENLKKRLDDEAKKATKAEQKLKVLTHGYQTRAGKLWSQIEATSKHVDTSATELECFEALKKQEQVAALHRSNNLIEEVKKQRDLENTLQHRYGDLLTEHARVEQLVVENRLLLRAQEEIAARNRALQEEMEAKNRVLQEKARLEEEMALKEQARLEEEISLKEKVRLEEEIALKEEDMALNEQAQLVEEIAPKEDMAQKENAQLVGEIAPKEDMARKEQAQFEEEISLKEDMTLKEQTQFEEELVPNEHGLLKEEMMPKEHDHLKEEMMPKEHDHLKEEMMPKDRAPVEEEMVLKDRAPVEEEMVPKDQAPVEEEMVPKDRTPVEEEMVPKDRALVEDVMAQEQAPLEEESAHNVQDSLVEKVIQEQPCSDEEMLQEEQHLEGEMVQEQTCLEEVVAPELQKELPSRSRASKTVESRVDMEPKHREISNIVGDSILCEEPMGSLAIVGGDPQTLEPDSLRPPQDTSKTNVSVGVVIVDKRSSQPNEVTEDGHGNAAVSTAPATLAFKSDVIAKTEVFPIPPTSESTDVSVKSGLDGQEAVPTTAKAVEVAEPEHTPISGLFSQIAEIEFKTESIAAGTMAEPVQEIQKIDDVQGDCK